MLSRLFIFFLLSIFSLHTYSQQAKGKITGSVKDSLQKQLPLVSISLFKLKDLRSPVKVTYTAADGSYILNNIDTGTYRIVFTHASYSEKQQSVTITADDLNKQLPDIILHFAGKNLKEVSVTGKKPLVEHSDDKVIYNAENDPSSKAGSVLDILRKTPFVSVDGDDNVMLNGQSNFKVLLNGRETSMFSNNVKEALRAFPGAAVIKVEVITSPSAKYDGEGIGGIINLITKKKVQGYNGTLSGSRNNLGNYNAGINFNGKSNKFGVAANFNVGGIERNPLTAETVTTPKIASVFTQRTLKGKRVPGWHFYSGNLELNMEIDSLNIVSAYSVVNSWRYKQQSDESIITSYPSAPASESYIFSKMLNENPLLSAGTDYIKKFKSSKEKEFSIRLNGEFGESNSFNYSEQDNPGTDRFVINNSRADNKQYTVQSDYILPLSKRRKLETGVKLIFRDASSNFESMVKYDPLQEYKLNASNTDNFRYSQNVYSAYGSYSFRAGKVAFRTGLRVEHTEIDGDFLVSSAKVTQSYNTFLPNVQMSMPVKRGMSMVITYSKRLQRPYIWNLNPFVNDNDSLNITFGNPGLNAQMLHSLAGQFRMTKGVTFAGITMEGTYSGNKILPYSSFDPATGVTSTTSLNIGREFMLSVSPNITTKITNDWNLSFNANLRYSHIGSKLASGISNSGIGGNANLSSSYQFSKAWAISSSVGLSRTPVNIQTKFALNYWYLVGASFKTLKEKLTFTLNTNGLFQEKINYISYKNDVNFSSRTLQTNMFRAINLGVSWDFGKLKENVSRKKGVVNDDLLRGS